MGKRTLDVLLIAVGSPHPIAVRLGGVLGIPPLGIAYLGAVLRRAGLGVRLVDLNLPGWSRDRFIRLIDLERPRIVGFSCTTESYRNAIRLGAILRARDRSISVVAGGPHVTFEDARALRTGAFDLVVRGEGESTVSELFPRLMLGKGPDPSIDGLSYLGVDGALVRTRPRRPIAELDSLPHPARDLLPLDRYGSPGAILTGRGCPGACPFCSATAMSGGRYRVRSCEAVVEEIRALLRGGISEIVFLDDTLTGDRAGLDRLLALMEKSRLRISWSCESRVDAVDPPLLRRMARLGCHSIQYGIESGSSPSRDRVGKGGTPGVAEDVIHATDRAGITPVCSFIIGLPWEDEAAVRETIAFALRMQREHLARVGFGVLVCYPGTQFWRHAERFGLRRRTGDFDRYTMHIPTCDTPRLDRDAQRSLHFEATLRQIREIPRELIEVWASPSPARATSISASAGTPRIREGGADRP